MGKSGAGPRPGRETPGPRRSAKAERELAAFPMNELLARTRTVYRVPC